MASVALVAALLGGSALAQEGETGNLTLPETVVTGTRLADDPFEQPYAFFRTEMDDLDDKVGVTPLDRLNYGPGMFLQRTAPAQSSPYIRGLTGEQTLLMFDGIRFSHAFMRPGPNQYAATIPQYSLGAIDVILGSSSTMQGSNGMTGAMDFRLAPAGRGVDSEASGWGGTRVDSGNGYQVFGGVDGVTDDWAYSLELGGTDFHDRVGGKDYKDHVSGPTSDGEIPNTGYEEYSFGLRLAYTGWEDHLVRLNAGHTHQSDAPRPDGYEANSFSSSRIWRYFDPQEFSYIHLTDSWAIDGNVIDRLETKLWWHRHSEEQFRRRIRTDDDVAAPNNKYLRDEFRDDSLDAFGVDVQAITLLGDEDQHELTWGVTYIYENTDNDYEDYRTPLGAAPFDPTDLAPHKPEDWQFKTTVPGDSEYTTLGLFIQDNWQVTDRFSLLGGLRYSRYDWEFSGLSGDTDDFTGNLRGIYAVAENHRLFAGVSRGFRAPNLSNLAGSGIDRGSSGNPASGNPDLDPEISLTYEAGWKWSADGNSLAFSVFHTKIDDFILQDVTDTVVNGDEAELSGFELAWNYGWDLGEMRRLSLTGAVSMVDDATVEKPVGGGGFETDNISRANRLYGNVGVKYEPNVNWWGLFQVRWHDEYDDVGIGDSGDVRFTVPGDADGSQPGYGVLDLVVGWQNDVGNRSVNLFVENIADKTYRDVGSGADGVGRNFGLAATFRF
jgi:hemoglobin/transferrin/lactoferrin receptor protein